MSNLLGISEVLLFWENFRFITNGGVQYRWILSFVISVGLWVPRMAQQTFNLGAFLENVLSDFVNKQATIPEPPVGVVQSVWIPILEEAERRLAQAQENFELTILRSGFSLIIKQVLFPFILDDAQSAMVLGDITDFWQPMQIGPKGSFG